MSSGKLELGTMKLFLDWRGCAQNLRPARPKSRSWTTDSDVAAAVIQKLQRALLKTVPGDYAWTVDAYAYGGFTDKQGAVTSEANTLVEALAKHTWTRRLAPFLAFREFIVVNSLLMVGGTSRLPGLYRDEEPVGAARLRNGPDSCSCEWRSRTSAWLDTLPERDRLCPECGLSSAVLVRAQQKMVDTLIASHALNSGIRALRATEHTEVWVCSPDADVVPALAGLASWGVPAVWLQSRVNHSFGYHAMLEDLGVQVLPILQD